MAKQVSENLSVSDAAKLLKVSPMRVRQHIESGRLRAEKIGTVFILKRSDVLAFKPRPRGRPAKKSK